MGGAEAEGRPLWRNLWNEGGTPSTVATGSTNGVVGGVYIGGDRGGGNNVGGDGDRVRNGYGKGYGYRDGGDGATGSIPLEEGGVSDTGRLPGGLAGGRIHLEGGVTNWVTMYLRVPPPGENIPYPSILYW